LLTPALAALLAIIAGPAMYAILASFRAWDLSDPASGQPFVGLQNYGTLLNDPYFWSALQTSTIFAVGAVTIEFILGFGVALLLMDQRIFKKLITTIVLIPLMVTPVVVGLIWRYMYDPSDGLVYYLLGLIPGGSNFGGLTSTSTALVAVMLVDVWEMTPFIILVMVAGLAALPDEVFEAARIDGAGRLEQLRSITLPLLRPLILLVVLLRFIDAFRTFDSIYIMTGGGPGTSTEVISLYDFNTAFQSFQMGYGMTLAIATLFILLAVGAALIPLMRSQR
jgi:multiple sugar transport system permease protein